MKWWMLRVERRSHKQGGDIHPPSEQHSTRPPAFQSPPPGLYFSLAYLTVISGEVEYTFSASPFLFLYVCF